MRRPWVQILSPKRKKKIKEGRKEGRKEERERERERKKERKEGRKEERRYVLEGKRTGSIQMFQLSQVLFKNCLSQGSLRRLVPS